MAALEEQWDVYKVRVGAPDHQAAAATAAALAGAGFTTVSSPALRPAQRAALVIAHLTLLHHAQRSDRHDIMPASPETSDSLDS